MSTSSTSPETISGGMDERYFPDSNKASLVKNFRYNPDGGWRNDRGWEPLVEYPASPFVATPADIADMTGICRFLAIWTRHKGSEEYYVQEKNGSLFYEFGNIGVASTRRHVLASNRHIPRPDEPGTQLIPYGRFSLLLNGHDAMLKWWGRDVVYPFGFTQVPPTPVCLSVQKDYNQEEGYGDGEGDNNTLTGIAVQFSPNEYLGLGDPTKGSVNFYSYKSTFVTDTGSESPLSGTANVSWIINTDAMAAGGATEANANARKYGVMLNGLEPGPDGTVKRLIYRTKNKKDGITGAGDNYFLCGEIRDNTTRQFLDVKPDNDLVISAPKSTDSITISSSYKYGATWNGSLWLAGGDVLPTKMIYSNSGLPEQFNAFSTFDVGVREGGAITALVPYYDVLLVFRERCIDAVFTNSSGDGYTCTTINQTIGTTATGSISLVPGVGVIFINKDGFYILSGGLRGGASVDVVRASKGIEKELSRVSVNALCRATATYSDREKEYWCHFPVDGDTENTHGAVLNTITKEWSLRGDIDEDHEASFGIWTFTRLATDSSGWIIIGLKPNYFSNFFDTGYGLQVWSARKNWGAEFGIVAQEEGDNFDITWSLKPVGNCIWQSTWNDFGDDSVKKRILSVEVEMLTEGENTIELEWASDYNLDWISAGAVKPQIAEYNGTTNTDPTFDNGANIATWNVSKWQDHKPTRLRWDVKTGLVSYFAFRIKTTNVCNIIKYQTNFIGGTVKTPNVRMPGAS